MPPTELRTWTIEVPAPAPWLTANKRRRHWHETEDRNAWKAATIRHAMRHKLPRKLLRVHITALLRFRTNAKRDPNNWNPTTKAMVDALVQYGLVVDDNARHVVGPDHRLGEKLPAMRYGPVGHVVLVISELAPDGD